jgi:hypothetical protein
MGALSALDRTLKGTFHVLLCEAVRTNCTRWLQHPRTENSLHEHGFGGISSRRTLTKPLIAAVNGIAYGGGTELILNCDLVIASEKAKFALPEVSRGVVAAQGGIPRLSNAAGHQVRSSPPSSLRRALMVAFLVGLRNAAPR